MRGDERDEGRNVDIIKVTTIVDKSGKIKFFIFKGL